MIDPNCTIKGTHRHTKSNALEPIAHARSTPGPWLLELKNSQPGEPCGRSLVSYNVTGTDQNGYRGSVANGQDCEHIAGIDKDEMRANAHLIAAAPDMLAELKAQVARLLKIIAKAEGREA